MKCLKKEKLENEKKKKITPNMLCYHTLPLYPHKVWRADIPEGQDYGHFWTSAPRISSESLQGFLRTLLISPENYTK